jgi:glycerophosphoryl diester phosphodiesterase
MKRNIFVVLLFFTVSLAFNGCKSNGCLVIAHRGASGTAPENTLASVNKAWQLNSDAVEVDVHLSADNKIMVIHDANTERTSGKSMLVRDCSSEQLRKLDVGSFICSEFAGERIPFLKDVIETIPEEKKLFVEIKSNRAILPFLKKLIDKSSKTDNIVIISFNLELLSQAKTQMPDIPMYWLVYPEKNQETGKLQPYDSSLIRKAAERGLDGLDVYHSVLTKSYVKKTHAADLDIYVWTVNDTKIMEKMYNMNVDGITTDYPAEAKVVFEN